MKDEAGYTGENRDLLRRTRDYALIVIRLYSRLPHAVVYVALVSQLLRSGTSPGAHYREAQRAKSTADFISKIEGALQELAESAYWLELLHAAELIDEPTFTAA